MRHFIILLLSIASYLHGFAQKVEHSGISQAGDQIRSGIQLDLLSKTGFISAYNTHGIGISFNHDLNEKYTFRSSYQYTRERDPKYFGYELDHTENIHELSLSVLFNLWTPLKSFRLRGGVGAGVSAYFYRYPKDFQVFDDGSLDYHYKTFAYVHEYLLILLEMDYFIRPNISLHANGTLRLIRWSDEYLYTGVQKGGGASVTEHNIHWPNASLHLGGCYWF